MVRAPVEVVVSETGAAVASGAILEVGKSAETAAREVENLNRRVDDGSDAFKRLEDGATALRGDVAELNKKLDQNEKATGLAAKSTSTFGGALKTAAGLAAGLLGVLGTIAAFRGLRNLVTDSIAVASSFEQYEVRLGALLGSQEEANRALERFTELSARTPFAVSQIVAGAGALGAAALGNRERLEELTQTAANLAAVTGGSFEETSANLARALNSGIASARLFRDRGVTAIIEAVQGIPDATKLSLEELDEAFRATFGAGGTFGTAAEDLSKTLGGALSNIGDAATNTKAALGDALSPAVINAAREVIIPFLQRLERLIKDNEDAIRGFAGDGVKFALEALLGFVQGGLTGLEMLSRLADFARTAVGAFLEFSLTLEQANLAVASFGAGLPFASAGQKKLAEEAAQRVQLVEGAVNRLADSEGEAENRTARFREGIEALRSSLEGLEANIARTDFAVRPDTTRPDLDLPTGDRPEAKALAEAEEAAEKAAKERAAALARVEAITERLRMASERQIEPLNGQLERLRQQRAELEEQARLAGNLAAAQEGLELISGQIAEVERQKTALVSEQEVLFARLSVLVEGLGRSAPDFAEEIERAALAAVEAGGGLAKVNAELRSIVGRAGAELQREQARIGKASEEIGKTLAGAVTTAFAGSLKGEAVNFAELLADTSAKLLEDSLKRVLDDVGKNLKSLLANVGGEGGFLSGLGGEAFGSALGVGLGVLAGGLRGSSSSVSSGFIKSAVTEARDVRGVVAGPQSIPIFQLGDKLEEALEETNGILRAQLDALQRLAGGAGPGGLPAGGGLAAELSSTSVSLV